MLAAGRAVSGEAEARARTVLGLDAPGASPAERLVFGDCDVLLAPTLLHPPPLAEGLAFASLRDDLYTQAWSGLGLPVISIPGPLASDGMPTAVQVIGRHGADQLVLDIAAFIQSRTDYHLAVPPAPPAAIARTADAHADTSEPDTDLVPDDREFGTWVRQQADLAVVADGRDLALMSWVYASITADLHRVNRGLSANS